MFQFKTYSHHVFFSYFYLGAALFHQDRTPHRSVDRPFLPSVSCKMRQCHIRVWQWHERDWLGILASISAVQEQASKAGSTTKSCCIHTGSSSKREKARDGWWTAFQNIQFQCSKCNHHALKHAKRKRLLL